jgi:hypothetical protein
VPRTRSRKPTCGKDSIDSPRKITGLRKTTGRTSRFLESERLFDIPCLPGADSHRSQDDSLFSRGDIVNRSSALTQHEIAMDQVQFGTE